jgi:membrane fusion protein, multidrug efflux system
LKEPPNAANRTFLRLARDIGSHCVLRVLLETRSNAVVVPSAAIQRGPNGLFVWAVSGKDIAEPRPIETAQTYDNLTIVTSGLSGGERVVTDGQYRLQRNAPVTFTSPQIAGSAGNS